MMGFLGGRKNRAAEELIVPTLPSLASPPPLPPVHTIPPPMMRSEVRAPGVPPPLPMHPRDLMPPPRPMPPPGHVPSAPAAHPTSHIGLAELPSAPPTPPPTAADIVASHSATPSNYELMRLLFDAREALSNELAIGSKEYQVLRSLKASDLDVCQDLVTELTRRLDAHPLHQSLAKLNEAYALALRYRRPG
jgi:hypothetical protein